MYEHEKRKCVCLGLFFFWLFHAPLGNCLLVSPFFFFLLLLFAAAALLVMVLLLSLVMVGRLVSSEQQQQNRERVYAYQTHACGYACVSVAETTTTRRTYD